MPSAPPPPRPAPADRGPADPGSADRSIASLLARHALAQAGGVLAYLPLLVLLLPIKVARVADAARLDVLSAAVVWGAVAASASNLLFGWLSDRDAARGRGRRRGLAAGLAATLGSYALFVAAESGTAIVGATIAFQVAVNMLLAPLFALMGDEVPDWSKGRAGGLLTLGVPCASAVSALLVALDEAAEGASLLIVGTLVCGCVLPLLLSPARTPETAVRADAALRRRDLLVAWTARLLVQVAGTVLFVYLLYYFATLAPGKPLSALAPRVGTIQAIAFTLPLPVALVAGIASDRLGRRKPFLIASALAAAAGLVVMAVAAEWRVGTAGFALYAMGSAVFLALNATFAMQLTGGASRRGRDLGLLNLANTLPSLAGPALAWSLATPDDFGPALWALALLAVSGGALVVLIHERN